MGQTLTPEELDVVRQMIAARGSQAPEPGPADLAAGAPAPAPVDPYKQRAYQYNAQADALDKEAAAPAPQAVGAKQHVVEGIRAAMENFGRLGAPGGFYGQEEQRQKDFTAANTQRVNRAKDLRGQAQDQQDLSQRTAYQNSEVENQNRDAELRKTTEKRLQQTADNPVGNDIPAGGSRVFNDPHSGKEIPGSRIEGNDKPPVGYNLQQTVLDEGNGKYGRYSVDMRDGGKIVGRIGDAPAPSAGGGAAALPQMAQATIDGEGVIGGYDRKTNTFAPAKLQGDPNGAPVHNATSGNANARAGTAATVDLVNAQRLLKGMQDTYARISSGKSQAIGADDMALLSSHIAMTFGTVKGARTGKDLIEAHLNARSLPDALSVLAQKVLNGGQLSAGQRQEFVELAKRRVDEMTQSRKQLQDDFGAGPATPQPGGGFVIPGGALDNLMKGGR